MSAGSAQEQIPTRTRSVGLDDLFVDAGWDDAVDVDRLRDVLEGLLPDALEDEVMTDALGRRRAHDDLPTLRRPGEARGDVRRGARRREGPPLRRAHAELGGAHERLAGVDAHVELDGREDATVLLVEARRPLVDRERRARRARDSWRSWSADSSSVFLAPSSACACASRVVISLKAAPSSPISSRAPTDARAAKSPSPTRRAATASASIGRTTTDRIVTVSTTPAERIVSTPIRI